MRQLQMEGDDYTLDTSTMSSIGDITINLNDTYGTTTTYLSDTITITGPDSTYVINDGTFDLSNYNISWPLDNNIDPDEVEKMCNEYPALEKVWRNFKSVYDMCKQDYQGKKEAGELDD
jgi:hypothetical protein